MVSFSLQMVLVASILSLCLAVCCSDGTSCLVNPACVDLFGSNLTKACDWLADRELVLLESLDEGNVAWIELCDLLSHSLCCGYTTQKNSKPLFFTAGKQGFLCSNIDSGSD